MPQNSLGRAFVADLFRQHPPALDLLNEVVSFFGTSLQVLATETEGEDTSNYVINIDTGNLIYHDASIFLNTRSNRVPAAACHELLHLQLFTKQLPSARGIELGPEWGDLRRDVAFFFATVNNAVHHEIFLADFLRIGFPLNEFVVPSSA